MTKHSKKNRQTPPFAAPKPTGFDAVAGAGDASTKGWVRGKSDTAGFTDEADFDDTAGFADAPGFVDEADFTDAPDALDALDVLDALGAPDAVDAADMDGFEPPTSVGLPPIRPIAVVPGSLYLVGTPIGNLGDLSPRAAAVLAAVDRIAAEDTRRTLRLLSALGIRKSLVSYHEHNARTRGPELVARLAAGETIALVSDAGMPSISDPGEDLVRLCIENMIPITVVPGPTAAMSALALSGLRTDRFAFEGFLPASGRERRLRLAALIDEPRTQILYEAPHRLRKLLAALAEQGMGERRVSLARELTKRFEEIGRSTVAAALAACDERAPRGEYVVVLEGRDAYAARCLVASSAAGGTNPLEPAAATADVPGTAASLTGSVSAGNGSPGQGDGPSARQLLADLLGQGFSVKDAAREAARRTGLKRSELYAQALALHDAGDRDA